LPDKDDLSVFPLLKVVAPELNSPFPALLLEMLATVEGESPVPSAGLASSGLVKDLPPEGETFTFGG